MRRALLIGGLCEGGVRLPGRSGRGHLLKAEKRGFMLEWAGRKSGRGKDRNRGGGCKDGGLGGWGF